MMEDRGQWRGHRMRLRCHSSERSLLASRDGPTQAVYGMVTNGHDIVTFHRDDISFTNETLTRTRVDGGRLSRPRAGLLPGFRELRVFVAGAVTSDEAVYTDFTARSDGWGRVPWRVERLRPSVWVAAASRDCGASSVDDARPDSTTRMRHRFRWRRWRDWRVVDSLI